MIEVTDGMVEEKRRQATGESPFLADKVLDGLALLDGREYRKLPPALKLLIGYHLAAHRRAVALAKGPYGWPGKSW